MNKFARGSEWRKWDLHVHTPYSLVQHYGDKNNPEVWENYITDLEKLENFAVIGVNDYLFIDGYKKLRGEQQKGRLANLKLFPVIEFRIDKFSGIDFGNLKRINLHVIFSDEIDIDTIESQFLNTLTSSYKLASDGSSWTRSININSLEELGNKIKENIPNNELHKYGSDLEEGFNNLNLEYSKIIESLNKDCFHGKYLLAVGKTEWDALKWSDSSIAEKKTIINGADIVFTAAETIANFIKAQEKLKAQGVNDLLLDCSDAHTFSSDNKNKDRIGNCYTWIKADPSFKGLKQILIEPEERIFIGENPPIFDRVKNNRTKYLKRLQVSSTDGYSDSTNKWFNDVKIDFNHELVAIIGNKGSGKSAISDIIALCSSYEDEHNFSFLTKEKFKKGHLAKKFQAKLIWENQKEEEIDYINLNEFSEDKIPKLKYLSQGYFETITNEINNPEGFRKELENVVFSHIDDSMKLGTNSFKELIELKRKNISDEIESIKNQLREKNNEIISLENKLNPSYKKEIEEKIKEKEDEIKALIEPEEVLNPQEDNKLTDIEKILFDEIENLKEQLKAIEEAIDYKNKEKTIVLQEKEELINFLGRFNLLSSTITRFLEEEAVLANKYDVNLNELVKFSLNASILKEKITKREELFNKLVDEIGNLETVNSLYFKAEATKKEIKEKQKSLDEPNQKYQKYLLDKETYQKRKIEIEGKDENDSETIKYYKNIKKYLEEKLENDIDKARDERLIITKNIFYKKQDVIKEYKNSKSNIDSIIEDNKDLLGQIKIEINAALTVNDNFKDKTLGFITKNVSGSFYSSQGSITFFNELIKDKNFDEFEDVNLFLNDFVNAIFNDKREGQKNSSRNLKDQIKEPQEFYDYLFSLDFIDYMYELKQNDKNLSNLSPGERGALLLIFYLLLDNDDKPLVIDQPEDNLDNFSVSNILVPFIKKAKSNRQIIIVTHNPNLAVVSDAEQVICVGIDKSNNSFSFISGSIENIEINKKIIEILEGAMPAFNVRKTKYRISE